MLKFFPWIFLLFYLQAAQGALNESNKPTNINVYLQQSPPFSTLDGEVNSRGILIDYWQQWARVTGINVTLSRYQQQAISGLANVRQPAIFSGLQLPEAQTADSATQKLFTIHSRFYSLNSSNHPLPAALFSKNARIDIGGLLPAADQLPLFASESHIHYQEYAGLLELCMALYSQKIDALVLFEGENAKESIILRVLSFLFHETLVTDNNNALFSYATADQQWVLEWVAWGNQLLSHGDQLNTAISHAANPVWGASADMKINLLLIVCLLALVFVYNRYKRKKDIQFKTLLDDSPYPLAILSLNGKAIYYLNDEVQALFPTTKINNQYYFDEEENQLILSDFINKASHKVVIDTAPIRLLVDNCFHDIEVSAKRVLYQGKTAWLCYLKDVNALLQAEIKLNEERELLRKVLDSIPEQILFKSPKGTVIGCNQAWAKANDTTVVKATGKRLSQVISEELANKQKKQESEVWHGDQLKSQEWLQQNDQQLSLINTIKLPLYNDHEEIFALLSIESDITDFYNLNKQLVNENLERKKIEVALAKQHTLLSTVFAVSLDPIGLLDQQGRVLGANNAFAVLMGCGSADELLGKLQSEFLAEERSDWAERQNMEVLESQKPLIFDELIFSEGKKIWYEVSKTPFKDEDNNFQGIVIMARDITLHKQTEEKLTSAASDYEVKMLNDQLTGIANRRAFDLQFEKLWEEASNEQELLSLVMCDIDFFKPYNDNYGHQEGDRALQQVAQALQKAVDQLGGFVARYGGEEFIVLIKGGNATKALKVAEGLRQAIAQAKVEHLYSPVSTTITMSMGLSSILPSNLNTMAMLLAEADAAMYESKKYGRDQISVH